jgi:hypothetical protein
MTGRILSTMRYVQKHTCSIKFILIYLYINTVICISEQNKVLHFFVPTSFDFIGYIANLGVEEPHLLISLTTAHKIFCNFSIYMQEINSFGNRMDILFVKMELL